MGRTILRFETGDGPRYLVYSSIVDAPITYGMTLEEFQGYYRGEHGEQGMRELPDRISRADLKGSSGHRDASLEDAVCCNRAGRNETRMTVGQMRDWYCCKPEEREQREREHDARPVGTWRER